ncbi:A/G-specific adenine glycosylase [Leekyejoonella antrihumi]|uniref:Adenine DNA glycosylase n=1 Tax=Leekyejoonella antrihumi TaxID=1660198 RepID=A0A563DXN8_9MICO|nr:A/G-specific adenine glycosylase [Leekyejoonella antrihumi]TWP34722.1 A/G-specific adenine glycosylase [Leekyejoonella antrihumi]
MSDLHDEVLRWYAAAARDLPWRRADATPWGVYVSEIMLQQTPVSRVEPVWHDWMHRWPTPADLAAESPGEAVRAWDRLGYPRRALRLHAAAVAITEQHNGVVPESFDQLLVLPGVGTYTAAAVSAFAFGIRVPVVDTNIRRVHARLVGGVAQAAASLTAAERDLAAELLPEDPSEAATWNVAVMELGALVCTARAPRCGACPVADRCAWQLAGAPAYDGPARRGQKWAGTDRQVRGRLLRTIREADGPVERPALDVVWHDQTQRERALSSLVEDGLVEPLPGDRFALPR